MKKVGIDKIRNLGIISHGGAGKTSLAEALLFTAGAVDRLGRTDDGTATMDHDPEEIRRKISISAAIAPCPWRDHKVNIIDTPGYFDFVGEVRSALRVVEGAVVVLDALAGIEVGTEMVWRYADEHHLPRLAVVNKMDRENADFYKVLEALKRFKQRAVVLTMPIGAEAKFRGVVDLVRMKALLYGADGSGRHEEADIPAELADRAAKMREALIEAAAEGDDALLEKYLDGAALSPEEIWAGLRAAVRTQAVVPVLCASAQKNIGAAPLLDACVDLLPSPAEAQPEEASEPKGGGKVTVAPAEDAPFSALVFKTMADPYVGKLTLFRVYSGVLRSDSHIYNAARGRNERIGQLFTIKGKQQEPAPEVGAGDIGAVAKLQETTTGDTLCDESRPVVFQPARFPRPAYSVAVQPKSKGDEEKIGAGLARLIEEDPTLVVERQPDTGQLLLCGMGEMHLDVITERLRRKFGVDVALNPPRIPYKETIRGSVKVEGKHKKQTGGRGQYGHVWIGFEPLPPGSGFEFVDKVFGGSVPRQYIPAVEKGLREVIQEGVLAGYPATDFRALLYDGSYHTVDSSEMAFKIAASLAFKKGMQGANPVLLEPIMNVEVIIPDAYMGDVIGDLNKKRGRILGMEPRGGIQAVRAIVPMAEMARYAIDLRSITQGRGTFSMEFASYEEVPANVAEAIVAAAQKDKDKDKA